MYYFFSWEINFTTIFIINIFPSYVRNDIVKFIMMRLKDHMLILVPDHNRPDGTAIQVPVQDLDHRDDHAPGLLNVDGVHLLIVVRHLVGVFLLIVVGHLLVAEVDDRLLLVGGHHHLNHNKGVVMAMEVWGPKLNVIVKMNGRIRVAAPFSPVIIAKTNFALWVCGKITCYVNMNVICSIVVSSKLLYFLGIFVLGTNKYVALY